MWTQLQHSSYPPHSDSAGFSQGLKLSEIKGKNLNVRTIGLNCSLLRVMSWRDYQMWKEVVDIMTFLPTGNL
jgi:hypothetical protein